ncbi:MAG: TPM domain-containing protein [Lactimicrobium massiliense]|nr:TPM domain-containing protein [Lactimicrobium massiliense]MDD6674796.1 TPM domain-containing protein [Lactimicrobium massiliense]
MKKIWKNTLLAAAVFLMALFICIPLLSAVRAEDSTSGFADEYDRLIDMGEIVDESDEEELLAALDELSERQKLEVAIATVESLEGEDIGTMADDIYDRCNFGYGEDKDGVLLLVSKNDREWYISTCGYGITAFTDAGIQYIGKQMKSDLSDGNYAAAFHTYIDQCDQFITQARTGHPYDRSNLPKGKLPMTWTLISLSGGLALGLVIAGMLRGQMKSVRYAPEADHYVRDGSLNITRSNDMFLYRTVNKTVRSKDSGSSTHTSSSGRTHGGGGGSF